MPELLWQDTETLPAEPGIYPIVWCCDPHEGQFCTSGAWDGAKWDFPATIGWLNQRCETRDEAEAIADAHDIEDGKGQWAS